MGAVKVGVMTGGRAEYGLLAPLIRLIEQEPLFRVSVFVTGSHLSERFGSTVREVESDGHSIAARIPLPLADDSEAGVTKATAAALSGFADAFASDRPDILVILGDRTEALAAATAALLARIPIVHLHGGEATEGAVDDAIRHAITKMSWLHFTSTDEYRRRVVQMGENPGRVFDVGALGVDNARRLPRMTKQQLEDELGPLFGPRTAVVTFHPVTLDENSATVAQFRELLSALEGFDDMSVVFTRPNADAGNVALFDAIDRFVREDPDRRHVFSSLGAMRYLSLVAASDVCVGNSSSGIIEAGALGTPSVDIGDRQRGRVRGPSVLHCDPTASCITEAIERALAPAIQSLAGRMETPYGDGRAAERIVEILRREAPGMRGTTKRFRDLAPECVDAAGTPEDG